MVMNERCPDQPHFHAALKDVNGDRNSNYVLLADSPEAALQGALLRTDNGWVGSVEIYDDLTDKPSDMPLLDFWKD